MNKDEIFNIIKNNLIQIIYNIEPSNIFLDSHFSEIGVNSIERVEVIVKSIEDTGIKVTLSKLKGVESLSDVVNVLYDHASTSVV